MFRKNSIGVHILKNIFFCKNVPAVAGKNYLCKKLYDPIQHNKYLVQINKMLFIYLEVNRTMLIT